MKLKASCSSRVYSVAPWAQCSLLLSADQCRNSPERLETCRTGTDSVFGPMSTVFPVSMNGAT